MKNVTIEKKTIHSNQIRLTARIKGQVIGYWNLDSAGNYLWGHPFSELVRVYDYVNN